MYASYRDTEMNVLIWLKEKGILDHGTAVGQSEKCVEEANELKDACVAYTEAKAAGDEAAMAKALHEARDACGDTLVTLVATSALLDIDVIQCFQQAYLEIKPRKGRMMPDGKFHKESV